MGGVVKYKIVAVVRKDTNKIHWRTCKLERISLKYTGH